METKISISISMPKKAAPEAPAKPGLLERVEYAVDCFECNHEPEKAYAFIRKVNNLVQAKEPGSLTAKDKEILKAIRPIINKFGFMDSKVTVINPQHMSAIDSEESETNYKERKRDET